MPFHVFLSHSSADKPAVEELARWLGGDAKAELLPDEGMRPRGLRGAVAVDLERVALVTIRDNVFHDNDRDGAFCASTKGIILLRVITEEEVFNCRLALWQVLLLLPSVGPRVGKSMPSAPLLACFQRLAPASVGPCRGP